MSLIKKFKVPLEWSEKTSSIINEALEDLFNGAQPRYIQEVTSKPKDTEGQNGELRSDTANSKAYLKQNGTWKEITLS